MVADYITYVRCMAMAAVLASGPAGQAQAQPPIASDHKATGGRVLSLPRDLEMRMAVNALPKELRAGAT